MSFTSLIPNRVVTFKTRSPSFLKGTIENARVTAVLSAEEARKRTTFDQQYVSIYPSLPQGTPNNPDGCIVYEFEMPNKTKIWMADQWIVEASIEIVVASTIKVTLPMANVSDVSKIRDMLTAAGYRDFSVDIVS